MNKPQTSWLWIVAAVVIVALLFATCAVANLSQAPAAQAREISRRARNRIEDTTHIHRQLRDPAGASCRRIRDGSRNTNRWGQHLFTWWQSATWCWANGRFTSYRFNTWYDIGDQWWNSWHCRNCPSSTVRGGDRTYKYRRTHAAFEACVTWFCHTDTVYVAQTIRSNGTSASSIGG